MTRPRVSIAVPYETRTGVLVRAKMRCERCAAPLDRFPGYSLQHRRARGMGGSRRPDTHSPFNLAALCGSATTPGGCHQWVESHPGDALFEGWRVPQHADPAGVPVLLLGERWVLLSPDYGYEDSPAPAVSSVH